MPELQKCEYFLVQYVPSPLRETRVPIGLFLFDASGNLVRKAFARDWRRIRCLEPQADLEMLSSLCAHFERWFQPAPASGESFQEASGALLPGQRLRRMHAEDSGGLQISAPSGVLTGNPEAEFDILFREHIESPPAVREKLPPRTGSRPWIHAQVADALRRHALWNVVSRDLPVAEFTAPGDGFRIDFSYRPNGVTKYLHALSLERDWNQAKLLSYTLWRIQQKTKAQMTAVVADPLPGLATQNCREILASAHIDIQPLSALDPYLQGVSRELGRS